MKRNGILIAIFVVTTIIASCFTVYFGLKLSSEKSEFESKIENLNSQISSLKSENSVVENNSDNTQVEEKIVYKYERPTINTNKCLNPTNGASYSFSRGVDSNYLDLTCTISSNRKVSLTFNNVSSLKDNYGYTINNKINVNSTLNSFSTEIANFSADVIDVYLGYMGQGIGQETVLFLMKDGSVEYLPIKDAFKNNTFKSYGKLSSVNDIVEIINGNVKYENGGNRAVFAIKQDGSFYELSTMLKNTGKYN